MGHELLIGAIRLQARVRAVGERYLLGICRFPAEIRRFPVKSGGFRGGRHGFSIGLRCFRVGRSRFQVESRCLRGGRRCC